MHPRAMLATLVLVAAAAASCSRDPQVLKQQYVARGDRYFAAKKYAEAVIEYRNAVAQDGRDGTVRYKLGETYYQLGKYADALGEYVRAGDLMPDNVAAQIAAGRGLLLERKYPEAKARAQVVLAKEPKNVDALILLGNASVGLSALDDAISQVHEAIDADPGQSLTYTNLAFMEYSKGDKAAAVAALKRAVEVAPNDAQTHLNLANLYWASGRLTEAESELTAAWRINQKSPTANKALATFYVTREELVKAEPYLKVYAEVGETLEAKFTLVDFYIALKRVPDARAMLESLQ
jgi:tetratricopeptide (TPR) repeat protein